MRESQGQILSNYVGEKIRSILNYLNDLTAHLGSEVIQELNLILTPMQEHWSCLLSLEK